jgi:hypothetical protein
MLLPCVSEYRDRCICHFLATSDAMKASSARVVRRLHEPSKVKMLWPTFFEAGLLVFQSLPERLSPWM